MLAIEDEESQKNGIVFIQFKVGEQKGLRPQRQILWRGYNSVRGYPGKPGGAHLCFERQSLPFVRLAKLALEYHASNRVRVHEGTRMTRYMTLLLLLFILLL